MSVLPTILGSALTLLTFVLLVTSACAFQFMGPLFLYVFIQRFLNFFLQIYSLDLQFVFGLLV